MKYKKLGTTDIETSVIGLGTWAMGGWMWGGGNDKDSVAAIHSALDSGVNLIDTAPAYGLGRSEEIVGEAIKGRRDKVVIATKCGLVWHTDKGNHFFDEEGKPVHRYLGADSIRYELEQSLKRLGTDYIDLYITHWQDPTTPVSETMAILEELKKEGKIRAIGISNVNKEEMSEYLESGTLDSIQEKYSMLDREIESGLLPLSEQNNVSILSYSPLAQGLLTGKIDPERTFSGDDQRIEDPRFSQENRQKIAAMLSKMKPVADQHNITLGQLVIAWTVSQSSQMFALCGARNPVQAKENAAAGAVSLTNSELDQVSSALAAYF
ncbi:aldo/keto reductase [Endozoicomonas sp. OPT23]|uniref:aldo/keto reductase n=1 Tax=Endozoicomonas sp. OPT23 TaxID=2072845 RepID=UPI00129A754F|nr:aldo/keto reductase [Endozoicomonas sp. OPT23]MRI35148.1 aldo/keto reductase [Endozoicomonas sp. OPT23]